MIVCIRTTSNEYDPIANECPWLDHCRRTGIERIILFDEIDGSAGFLKLDHDGGVFGAEGFEEAFTGVWILDVVGGDVFEVIDDDVNADAGIAISWPAKAVGEVDWHCRGGGQSCAVEIRIGGVFPACASFK